MYELNQPWQSTVAFKVSKSRTIAVQLHGRTTISTKEILKCNLMLLSLNICSALS
jgi:hypothetical protein